MDQTNQMKISEWLDKKAAEGIDVSQIVLPDALSYDEAPGETIYFKEKQALRYPLHGQSSVFYCGAIRTLVLLQRSGQASRYTLI